MSSYGVDGGPRSMQIFSGAGSKLGLVWRFSTSPPFLLFPLFLVPPFSASLLFPRSRTPLFQLGDLGGAVSSSSGVRDRAPAEIDFGAF